MSAPIEVTTQFCTTVDDLAAAWAFIMEHLDAVGPDPQIHIKPIWLMSVNEVMDDADATAPRQFEISVSGMVHKADPS